MKKSLLRIVTLAVALAFPMGLVAQTTETKAGADTKTKKSERANVSASHTALDRRQLSTATGTSSIRSLPRHSPRSRCA